LFYGEYFLKSLEPQRLRLGGAPGPSLGPDEKIAAAISISALAVF
jgi:hypothetical protein